jgi:hypothetical protein
MRSGRPRLAGEEAVGDAIDRILDAARPIALVPGWATVELDRAATELLDPKDSARSRGIVDAPADPHLGATCRLLTLDGAPPTVLLEPSTEGLLAAALARHGEAYVALYGRADAGAPHRLRQAGFVLSNERDGPLGRQRLVRLGPVGGPFVIVTGLD